MKFRILLLFIIASTGIIANQGFAVDVNVFSSRDIETEGIAEIVWSVNRGDLSFVRTQNGWADTLEFVISISEGGGVVSVDTVRRIVEMTRGSMVTESFLLFDKISAVLPVNRSYILAMEMRDIGKGRSYSIERAFWMPDFHGELALSDIMLIGEIDHNAADGLFTRNGIKMIPNPSRIFGGAFPILYYYLEVYLANPGDEITARWTIFDSEQNLIHESEPENFAVESPELFILNGLDVTSLEPGKYHLDIEVTASISDAKINTRKSFIIPEKFVFSPSPETWNVEQEFPYIQYFLTKSDKDLYNALTDDGKREFIRRFWEERDTLNDIAENVFRRDVIGRWHVANSAFDESGGIELNGWKTERGRVYIKFGEPNSIERKPIEMETNPYEIWEYFDLEGGVIFVFADIRGINSWRLVHSTSSGEYYDPNWLERLKNPQSTIRSTTNE